MPDNSTPSMPSPSARASGAGAPGATSRFHPLALALLLVGALVVLLAHLESTVRHTDRSVFNADAGEYAVAGRQLARTGRLATIHTWPGQLTRPLRPPFPVVVGQPLVPLTDAALFAIGGERPGLVLVLPGLAYLAVVGLAALLAMRVTGSRAAGWLAGASVALAPSVLRYATEGLTEMPFTAFLTAALVLLWDVPHRPRFALLGLCLGLAQLTRPTMPYLLPAFVGGVLLMAPPGRRLRGTLVMLAVYLPAFAAFPLYHLVTAGGAGADPAHYNLLVGLKPEFAPWRVHRWIHPYEPWGYVLAHPLAVVRKVVGSGASVLRSVLAPENPVLGFLFVVYLVSPTASRTASWFRATVAALLGLTVGLLTLTLPDARYCMPLWPAAIALATGEAWRLIRLRNNRPWVTAALCAILIPLALGVDTARVWQQAWHSGVPARGGFQESEWRGLGRELAARVPRDAVVVSDVGTWMSWYADRVTLALPDNPAELRACEERLPLDAMLLSNEWVINLPESAPWRALYGGTATLPGWVRADSLSSGRLRAVLFLRAKGAPQGS